jgi:GT2 family glycosyltransferase
MITVAICTCNRAEKLSHLLDSFEQLRVPDGIEWELIVVDNNSADGTASLLAAKTTLPLRRCFEEEQGLAAARNHAVRAARGDIIALTDDDCRVHSDWLTVIAREFERDHQLGVLGGRVELLNPADFPITIRTGHEPLDLTGSNHALDALIGCNIVFRRRALEQIGPFDTRFGVGCGVVPSGDDFDFIYRCIRAGLRIRYTPDLLILHDHGRSTRQQVETLRRRYLLGRGGFYAKYLLLGDRNALKLAYWEVRSLLKGALHPAECRENLAVLGLLARGAIQFIRGARAVPPPRPGWT